MCVCVCVCLGIFMFHLNNAGIELGITHLYINLYNHIRTDPSIHKPQQQKPPLPLPRQIIHTPPSNAHHINQVTSSAPKTPNIQPPIHIPNQTIPIRTMYANPALLLTLLFAATATAHGDGDGDSDETKNSTSAGAVTTTMVMNGMTTTMVMSATAAAAAGGAEASKGAALPAVAGSGAMYGLLFFHLSFTVFIGLDANGEVL